MLVTCAEELLLATKLSLKMITRYHILTSIEQSRGKQQTRTRKQLETYAFDKEDKLQPGASVSLLKIANKDLPDTASMSFAITGGTLA